jgi:hypothetical protein
MTILNNLFGTKMSGEQQTDPLKLITGVVLLKITP